MNVVCKYGMRLEAGILEMLNLVRSEGLWPAPIITFVIQEIPLDIWLMANDFNRTEQKCRGSDLGQGKESEH